MTVSIQPGNRAEARNAALFARAVKARTFTNILTGEAPKGTKDIGKQQTEPGAPIVRVTDLGKGEGTEVTVDIVHKLTKKPTMGNKRLAGRGDTIKFAEDTLAINQGRHMVDDGGRMIHQIMNQPIAQVSRSLLGTYFNDLDDELTLYHLAGARGDYFDPAEDIVPLEADPEFSEIIGNPLLPANYGQHFYGGDATAIDDLDSSDRMTLEVVDNLALTLREKSIIRRMSFKSDDGKKDSPMNLLYVSPVQWFDLKASSSGKDWQEMMAKAMTRSKTWNHPVFKGDCIMRENILIKPMFRPVGFNVGSQVRVSRNDKAATTEIRQPGVKTERAILLGSQALGIAYGRSKSTNGHHFGTHVEKEDHGAVEEVSINWMNGRKKLRFQDKLGYKRDHGVITIDTAVSR